MNDNKDAFDYGGGWADKAVDSMLTIDAAIHDAVMALPPDERRDREKVNAAVRDGARAKHYRGNCNARAAASRRIGGSVRRSEGDGIDWPSDTKDHARGRASGVFRSMLCIARTTGARTR